MIKLHNIKSVILIFYYKKNISKYSKILKGFGNWENWQNNIYPLGIEFENLYLKNAYFCVQFEKFFK